MHIERLYLHHRIVWFALLLLFLLLLGPCSQFLLQSLHSLGVWFLGEDFLGGIGFVDQHSRTVGHAIGDVHEQSVLVHQCRILEPIGYRILLLGCFYQESILGIEVESLDLWQDGISITEEQRETVSFLPLCLQEISVCKRLCESLQHDVVWQEVGIFHRVNRLDVE